MSFNVCKVKNIDSVSHTYCGQEITAGATYTIQDSERVSWFNNDDLLADITADKAEIWDGSAAIDACSTDAASAGCQIADPAAAGGYQAAVKNENEKSPHPFCVIPRVFHLNLLP